MCACCCGRSAGGRGAGGGSCRRGMPPLLVFLPCTTLLDWGDSQPGALQAAQPSTWPRPLPAPNPAAPAGAGGALQLGRRQPPRRGRWAVGPQPSYGSLRRRRRAVRRQRRQHHGRRHLGRPWDAAARPGLRQGRCRHACIRTHCALRVNCVLRVDCMPAFHACDPGALPKCLPC